VWRHCTVDVGEGDMVRISWSTWLYIAAVVAAAVAILIHVPDLLDQDGTRYTQLCIWVTYATLALLFLICESTPTTLARQSSWSPSSAATLAAVVLLGPFGAAAVGAVAVLSIRRRVPLAERLFNGAMYAVAGFAAGWTCHQLRHHLTGRVMHRPIPLSQLLAPLGIGPRIDLQPYVFISLLVPFAAAAVVQVLVNHGILWGMLMVDGQSRAAVRRASPGSSPWLVMVFDLGFAPLGLVIAGLWLVIGPFAALIVLVPLYVARWAMKQFAEQQSSYQATLAALCQAVETKDFYTRGHSERVSRGSGMIARQVGMGAERAQAVRFAGMLHDVGKLGVPTKVLQKEGKLTEQEYAAIQLHPMRGLEIVREIGFLNEALNGIMHHHERIDGRGYPMGLANDEIPEFARIIAVADAFDSMTSTRAYRQAMGVDGAIEELRKGAGSQFDPRYVRAFIEALDRDGWTFPEHGKLTGTEVVTWKDHDDPTAPLRVAEIQ
jgi:HD domain